MKRKFVFAFVLALVLCLCLVPSAFATDTITDNNNELENKQEVADAEVSVEIEAPDGDKGQGAAKIESNSVQQLIDDTEPGKTLSGDDGTKYKPRDGQEAVINLKTDVSESITVGNGQTVTIDLNGKTLSSNGTTVTVNDGGVLTLKNGTVESTGGTAIVCNGTLNLNGVTVKTIKDCRAIESSGGNAVVNIGDGTTVSTEWNKIYAINGGTININGGTIGNCVYIFASENVIDGIDNSNSKGTVNINGGTIGYEILAEYGTVNVRGGTLNGYTINARQGTVNIYGGTFNNRGLDADHGIINIYNGTFTRKVSAIDGTVNIYGGSIECELSVSNGTVNIYNNAKIMKNVEVDGKGTLNVYGGTITGTITAGKTFLNDTSVIGKVNISGGTVAALKIAKNAAVNIKGGKIGQMTVAETYTAIVVEENEWLHPERREKELDMQPDDYSLEISGGYFYKDTEELVKGHLVKGKTLSALVDDYYQVIDDTASSTAGDAESVISLPKIIAKLLNSDNGHSAVSKNAMSIELKYTDISKTNQTPEAVSVIINGVEVEFTIGEDGTVVIAQEVLAALAPGSYVVTIATTDGVATITIVITD